MDRLMLRPEEAAELLAVGRTTLYKLIKSLEIPSMRLGKSIRIPVSALREWADRQGLKFDTPSTREVPQHERQAKGVARKHRGVH